LKMSGSSPFRTVITPISETREPAGSLIGATTSISRARTARIPTEMAASIGLFIRKAGCGWSKQQDRALDLDARADHQLLGWPVADEAAELAFSTLAGRYFLLLVKQYLSETKPCCGSRRAGPGP